MSGWYWLLWAVLSVGNGALFLVSWRNLHESLALLDRRLTEKDES